MSYSAFVTEVKSDNVANVDVLSDHLDVVFKNPPRETGSDALKYRVAVPGGDQENAKLIQLLQEHNVQFELVEP